MQDLNIRKAICQIGNEIGPAAVDAVHQLYGAEQARIASSLPPLATDLAYGPDERHRLDIYAPTEPEGPLPIIVWVHGGGFRRGDKGGGDVWQNANVGRMAAQEGFLGVVVNYRLAPEHKWPAGSEDLGKVVAWLKKDAPSFGGDPDRIFLAGSSAGAVHIAGYVKLEPNSHDLAGAIMLSGLYGITPMTDERDVSYFGQESEAHANMLPLEAVVTTQLPLLIGCAEFDPPRFQLEFVELLKRRLEYHGVLPRSFIASGHNHFSLAYHLGGSDRRFSDEISAFVKIQEN